MKTAAWYARAGECAQPTPADRRCTAGADGRCAGICAAPGQLRSFSHTVSTMLIYALAAPLIQIPIFAALGLYSRFWRYASTDELLLLVWAALIGGLAQGASSSESRRSFPISSTPACPRSIPLIAILLTLAFIAGPRLALRLWSQSSRRSIKASTAPLVVQQRR